MDILHRRLSSLAAVGVMLLALMVLAWGAQYKVSLYNSAGSASTGGPPAKLLSERERPLTARAASTVPNVSSALPLAPVVATLFAAFLLGLLYGTWINVFGRSVDEHSPQRYFGTAFFSFRPPPAIALAR